VKNRLYKILYETLSSIYQEVYWSVCSPYSVQRPPTPLEIQTINRLRNQEKKPLFISQKLHDLNNQMWKKNSSQTLYPRPNMYRWLSADLVRALIPERHPPLIPSRTREYDPKKINLWMDKLIELDSRDEELLSEKSASPFSGTGYEPENSDEASSVHSKALHNFSPSTTSSSTDLYTQPVSTSSLKRSRQGFEGLEPLDPKENKKIKKELTFHPDVFNK
jgi:hypothetical protein